MVVNSVFLLATKLLILIVEFLKAAVYGLFFLLSLFPTFFILSQHLPSTHGYADDSQLYFLFRLMSLESQVEAITVLESCIAEDCSWFTANCLMTQKQSFLLSAPVISWQRRQSILSSLVNLALNLQKVFETLDHGLMLKYVWMYI